MELHALNLTTQFQWPFDDSFLQHLSAKARHKAGHGTNRAEVNRSLWAEVFARVCIAKKLNIPNQQINITRTNYGKPVLRGTELHFNLSHAGIWIVMATDSRPVGVDVEQVRPLDPDAYQGLLSKTERQLLNKMSTESLIQSFYALWTAKESYLKAVGTGFLKLQNDLTIETDGYPIRVNGQQDLPFTYVQHYTLPGSYLVATSAFHNRFPDKITIEQPSRIARHFVEIV